MEDSVDIELYEEIVGNPAYSSSSDISKSDPVSFQFREPRQTECREEDNSSRARSRPDPRIIPHALAGKNSQEPRSCDTFVECGSSGREFYDNSTILTPTSNTSIFDTFATVAPDVEPTLRTSALDTFAILLLLTECATQTADVAVPHLLFEFLSFGSTFRSHHIYIGLLFTFIHYTVQLKDLFWQGSLRSLEQRCTLADPSDQISEGGPGPSNPTKPPPLPVDTSLWWTAQPSGSRSKLSYGRRSISRGDSRNSPVEPNARPLSHQPIHAPTTAAAIRSTGRRIPKWSSAISPCTFGEISLIPYPLSHLCGSSRGSLLFCTTAENRGKLQIYREDREGTALTAVMT